MEIYRKCGEYDVVREVYRKAIQFDVKGISFYQCQIARIYTEEENWSKTMEIYVEGLDLLSTERLYDIRYDWIDFVGSLHNEGEYTACIAVMELLEGAMEKDSEGVVIYLESFAHEYLYQEAWDFVISCYESLLK